MSGCRYGASITILSHTGKFWAPSDTEINKLPNLNNLNNNNNNNQINHLKQIDHKFIVKAFLELPTLHFLHELRRAGSVVPPPSRHKGEWGQFEISISGWKQETEDRRGEGETGRGRNGAVGLEKPQGKTKSKKRTKRKEKPYHLSDFLPGYHRPQRIAKKHTNLSLAPPSTHLSLSLSLHIPFVISLSIQSDSWDQQEICLFPSLRLTLSLLFYMIFPSNHSILILSHAHFISPSFLFFYLISPRADYYKPCGIDITNCVCLHVCV